MCSPSLVDVPVPAEERPAGMGKVPAAEAVARMGKTITVLMVMFLLTATAPAPAQPPPVPPEVIAKNLAENVLGENTVKRVKVTQNGRVIDIAWDAVLYKPSNSRETNREQLKGEAELATGSIMGVMRPEMIRYTILLGQRSLASGQRTRDGFTITYAKELGG